MTMRNDDKQELVKLRTGQMRTALDDSRFLIDNQRNLSAANRLYYTA